MAMSDPKMVLRSAKKAKIEERNAIFKTFRDSLDEFQNEVDRDVGHTPELERAFRSLEDSFREMEEAQEELQELMTDAEREHEVQSYKNLQSKFWRAEEQYQNLCSIGGRTDQDVPTPLVDPKLTEQTKPEMKPHRAGNYNTNQPQAVPLEGNTPILMTLMDNVSAMMSQFSKMEERMSQFSKMEEQLQEMKMERRLEQSSHRTKSAEIVPDQPMDAPSDLRSTRFRATDMPIPKPVSMWETKNNLTYPNPSKVESRTPSLALDDSYNFAGHVEPPMQDDDFWGNNATCAVGAMGTQLAYRLPVLEVGLFKGESAKEFYEWWPTFRDVYQERPDLDSATKLTYLKRHLRGRALQLASAHGRYEDAIKNLRQIFGLPRRLIKEMITDLDTLNSRNVDLVDLLVMVNSYLTIFKVIEKGQHDFVSTLLHQITRKLPREVRLKWSEKATLTEKRGGHLSVSDFSEFLIDIINMYEDADEPPQPPTSRLEKRAEKQSSQRDTWRTSHQQPKATMMFNAVGTMEESRCPFCGERAHANVSECRKVRSISIDTRRHIARTNNLCYRCLGRHHFQSCNAPRCSICNYSHHVLLHVDYHSPPRFQNNVPRNGGTQGDNHGYNTRREAQYWPQINPPQPAQVEEERYIDENQEVVEPVVTVLMAQALTSEETPSRKEQDFIGLEGSAKESHEGSAKSMNPAKTHEVSNQSACNDGKDQQPSTHLMSMEEPQLSEVSEKGQDTMKNKSLLDATELKTQTKVKKEERKSERPSMSKGSWKAHQQPKYQRVFNDVCTLSHDKCPFCDESAHRDIQECQKVALYPTSARWQLTRVNRLCFKCLVKHDFGKCKAPPCQKCQRFHNVLLHFGRKKTDDPNDRRKKKGGRDHNQRRQRQPNGGEVNVEERKIQKCRKRVEKTSRKEVEREPIMSNSRMPSEPIEPNQAESKGQVNERRKKMKRRPIQKEQVIPMHSKSKTEKPSVNVGCPEPENKNQPRPSEKSSKENNLVVPERVTKKEGSLDDFGQGFAGLNCKALRYLIEEIVAKVKYETPNRLGNQLSSKGIVS